MAAEWALVAVLRGRPVARHDTGLSPNVRAGDDTFGALELPGVALIHSIDGGALLESWTVDADWFGDTWFASVDEAKEAAREEWGSGLGQWDPVPVGIEDEARYALDRRAAS